MADLIFIVDLVVFAMVIACAASLLGGRAKGRALFPHSGVLPACGKQRETSGELSTAASRERENRLSVVLLMLPHLGRRVEQKKSAGIRLERPQ
jgi:hypothetical protein